jgi:hypothetical protein
MASRNRGSLRTIDSADRSRLSLQYWDWTQDPQNAADGQGGFVNLFTTGIIGNAFMGSASGEADDPWRSAGFYDPSANPFRSGNEFDPNNNPVDPHGTSLATSNLAER